MIRHLITILFMVITLASSNVIADASLDKHLEKIFDAHGGVDIWKETTNIQYQGDTFSQSRHAIGSTQRSFHYPDQFRISIEYPGNDTELRQLNQGKVWDHGKPGSEPFAKATMLQAMRMMPIKLLLEHQKTAKDLGTRKDEEGVLHHGVELMIDGLRFIIDSDAETGFILATWGSMEMMGQTMQFVTFYHDYRAVEGRTVAFKEEHYAMGTYTGHTEIKTVSFPESFADNHFTPAP